MVSFGIVEYRNIDGTIITTQIPVGYCNYELHKGYLTAREAQIHNCAGKHCKHCIRNEAHEYWMRAETEKTKKLYYDFIKKQYKHNLITMCRHSELMNVTKINEMIQYIKKNKVEIDFQTKSNIVSKTIKIPKRPNIIARTKNAIKLKYKKFINKLECIYKRIKSNNQYSKEIIAN